MLFSTLGHEAPPTSSTFRYSDNSGIATLEGSDIMRNQARRLARSTNEQSVGQSSALGKRITYPKRRINVACEVCRLRKTKCNGVRPTCGFCATAGAVCTYRAPECNFTKSQSSWQTEDDTAYPRDTASRPEDTESAPHQTRPPRDFEIPNDRAQGSRETTAAFTPSSVSNCLEGCSEILPSQSQSAKRSCSTTYGVAYPPELQPLAEDGSTCYLMFESFHPNGVVRDEAVHSRKTQDLDLDQHTVWRTLRLFVSEVLPWCPIIDQRTCSDLICQTMQGEFQGDNHATRLTLFMLSLGKVTGQCDDFGDTPSEAPGIDYFHAGCLVRTRCRTLQDKVRDIQGFILQSFYLLYLIRPVQSYEILRRASEKIVLLLQMRQQLDIPLEFHEEINRAYWACYLLEHELQLILPQSSKIISEFHEDVTLPMSTYDEPGMYWFLAEIALRRIVARPLNGLCWNLAGANFAPSIGLELSSQCEKWRESLPSTFAFTMDLEPSKRLDLPLSIWPILDERRAFLRAQWYSLQALTLWPNIVHLLLVEIAAPPATATNDGESSTSCDTTERQRSLEKNAPVTNIEYSRLQEATDRCINLLLLHVYAVEPLLQSRRLFLFANIKGLINITLMLLSVYKAERLRGTLAYDEEIPKGIRFARRCLRVWGGNMALHHQITKIESIMQEKKISI